MRDIWARICFGVTGFAAIIGVLFSSWITVVYDPADIAAEGSVPGAAVQANPDLFNDFVIRGLNTFVYFTILSNICVAVVCLVLMTNPHKGGKVFDVFRVFSLIAIIITGVVFNAILRSESHPVGFNAFNTNILHVFVPIMAVLGWLIFGPRIKFSWKILWSCAGIGFLWILFTFIRGAAIHWYPYPFINVDYLGYPRAIAACVVILLIAMGLGALVLRLDKVLPGEKPWLARPAGDQAGSQPGEQAGEAAAQAASASPRESD